MANVWLDENSALAQVRQNLDPVIFNVGNEGTPVILQDDFLLGTSDLIDIAVNLTTFFVERKKAYPGVRSDLPALYLRGALASMESLMREVYGISEENKITGYYGSYSLVSTPAHELGVLQRLPHSDSAKPNFFAMLLYLNPGIYGGTSFYRHNPTGFERISEERFPYYIEAAKQYMNEKGMPLAEYYKATDGHFTPIGHVDYKPNRMVVYPGNLLHSGVIDPFRDVNADPKVGRLTANIFLEFDSKI